MEIPLYKTGFSSEIPGLIQEVLESGRVASGPKVPAFEAALGEFLGAENIVATAEMSGSLALCLRHAGVRPGDDVLMAPMVCLATSCPVGNLFANIVWCDIDPQTGAISASEVRKRVTARTKAILVFHWAGYPARLQELWSVARELGLPIIEDASEALGAEYEGRALGAAQSDYTVYSFYPNRLLSTIEGAAISCRSASVASEVRKLRRYGIDYGTFRAQDGEINPRSDISTAGWNLYMNEVSAAVGLAQLKLVRQRLAIHRENGRWFDSVFGGSRTVKPLVSEGGNPSYWVYTLMARNRDALRAHLKKCGIAASSIHIRNDVYSCFGGAGSPLAGVEYFSENCLSLPCGWWMDSAARQEIAKQVENFGL